MTNSKRTVGLDEVLADYAHVSQDFDAQVLQTFIDKYPEHARALQRYAQVQLSFVPATPEEVVAVEVSDEELLPLQSKLLQRMHELRGGPSAAEAADAAKKLSSISGENATLAATRAVFGSSEDGRDLLFLSLTDSSCEVEGVPHWVYEDLGSYLHAPPAAVRAGITLKRQPAGLQRHSTQGRPIEPASTTWSQLVEDCISDEAVRNAILSRT
jgi:hypothetical protein